VRFSPAFNGVRGVMLAVMGLALAGGVAQAKPPDHHGPATLTIKARPVPSLPADVASGFPPKGTGLFGRLTAIPPACQRNRLLTAVYEFSRHDNDLPLERSLGVSTRSTGRWSTPAVAQFYSFERETVRVHVVVERTQLASGTVCGMVESPTLTVHNHKLELPPCAPAPCRTSPRRDRPALYGGTMTVQPKQVPSPFPPEAIAVGFPATVTILHGRLRSEAPACQRHRRVILTFRYPPSYEPVVRDYRIETDASGRWEAPQAGPGASPEPKVVRIVAAVKRQQAGPGVICARVESPVTNIRQQRINPCVVENNCGLAARQR
jgi:hypothetical protein